MGRLPRWGSPGVAQRRWDRVWFAVPTDQQVRHGGCFAADGSIGCQHRQRVCRPRWFRRRYILRSLIAIGVSDFGSSEGSVHFQDNGPVWP